MDIDPSGALSLTLGGATVRGGSDPDSEARSYDGRHGEEVVCTPRGTLATWSDNQ